MFIETLQKINDFIIPHQTYDESRKQISRKWLGHTKTYDLLGHILSDRYDTRKEKIRITYYPGTKPKKRKSHILKRLACSKRSHNFMEIWYGLDHKRYAVVKGQTDDPNLGEIPVHVVFDQTASFPYQVLLNLKHSTFRKFQKGQNLFSVDLPTEATYLSDTLQRLHSAPALREKYLTDSTSAAAKQPQKSVETATKGNAEQNAPVMEQLVTKQQPTVQEKREEWTEQLLDRMEKHDSLLAQKAKVESSLRMKPERKAQRLASIEKRLKQNEKAQAILNRKLKILEATQNRDDWKQIKQQERFDYTSLSAEQKRKQQMFADFEGPHQQQEVLAHKTDIREIKQLKKEAFEGYRFATRATKIANTTLRKLKDVKRQNTIFELSYVVREKIALEKAFKTETDMFKKFSMEERLRELKRQKREIVSAFREAKSQKNKSKQAIVQPILPGFEK